MKAWLVTKTGAPADVLALGERDAPEPVPGEIGVEVRATGLGLPDLFMCRGSYIFSPPIPFSPGQEVAGVVTDATHAPGFAVGQRVMGVTAFYRGYGGFAEHSVLVADATWPIPDAMSDVEAAAFSIPFRTAWIALATRARLAAGETLLVHGGAGGTGYAAIQLGKALGARVIAVAKGPEKGAFCRAQGADVVIDRSSEDFVEAVSTHTGGQGANVVFDPVGGETFVRSLDCLTVEGRLLAVGFASGDWGNAPTAKLIHKNLTVMGVLAAPPSPEAADAMRAGLLGFYDEGRIRPVIADRFAFDALLDAYAALESQQGGGKQVLVVSQA